MNVCIRCGGFNASNPIGKVSFFCDPCLEYDRQKAEYMERVEKDIEKKVVFEVVKSGSNWVVCNRLGRRGDSNRACVFETEQAAHNHIRDWCIVDD
jgi:hypothetical protein